ncbi:hypothetical protein PVIIG_05314 [Plasmodium vivax India VII]|uniref:Uncharacterized protein n=1 Tax=Plasmodium vivax India VII TaxID=1077284 RepID=A0A0J9S3L9_PLAVI|nr:hypothetical protein PVIIG_05314 [Plasmodium vivax India VII]
MNFIIIYQMHQMHHVDHQKKVNTHFLEKHTPLNHQTLLMPKQRKLYLKIYYLLKKNLLQKIKNFKKNHLLQLHYLL